MIFELFLVSSLVASDVQDAGWKTEVTWECEFSEDGREPFVMKGIVFGKPKSSPDVERPQGVLVTSDESDRYLNKGARGVYHVVRRPGEHWVLFDAAKGGGLILDFTGEEGRGEAFLIKQDEAYPFAKAQCQFQEGSE